MYIIYIYIYIYNIKAIYAMYAKPLWKDGAGALHGNGEAGVYYIYILYIILYIYILVIYIHIYFI